MKKLMTLIILILAFTVFIITSDKGEVMSEKSTNLEIVKLIPDMYNKDAKIADKIFDLNCLHNINGTLENEKGPEVIKKSISILNQQFSNSKTEFLEILGSENSVAVRWSWSAINRLTKTEWKFNGNTVFHFKNGRIIEYWAIDDRYREMQKHGFTIVPPTSK